jgi:hypothetical protein
LAFRVTPDITHETNTASAIAGILVLRVPGHGRHDRGINGEDSCQHIFSDLGPVTSLRLHDHAIAQHPDPFDLGLDDIAILQVLGWGAAKADAVRRAGRDDVARFDCHTV